MPAPDLAQMPMPRHLAERISVEEKRSVLPRKRYVLYWMHHAIRDHDNPALDVAVVVGNHIARPVLVYQGLGGNHPYNADRHHVFIMEGAREVQQGLQRRQIAYRFFLPADPGPETPLTSLAQEAALVITETFPSPPFPRWIRALAERIAAPLWTVDCCCIIPMQRIKRRFERAFQFRNHTRQEYTRRLKNHWKDQAPETAMFTGPLPLKGLDLQKADIPALCAGCKIDHSIGPVHHTVGGSAAGYERWELFKQHGLRSYARLRNDAAVMPPKGVSRLSPYLHYGMVSPLRIAREASAVGSDGAAKFLDELLIWRELAHNFCFFTPEPEALASLPAWARQTLEKHGHDPRPELLSPERLMRAQTGDPLWDAAQRSLLRHGELHNNVRMTWGKALLQWTRSPAEALRLLIDLNHRFALDGCDPNSYGGILWCLGLFDRPFRPEQPIIGALRPRPLPKHAHRLDLKQYDQKTASPASGSPLAIAVVGADLAGLRAAGILADHGHQVTIFERAVALGGRWNGFEGANGAVDAGVHYFTVRDPRFKRHVASWMQEGLVVPWKGVLAAVSAPGVFRQEGASSECFVALPCSQRLAEHLAAGLNVRYDCRLVEMAAAGRQWRLLLAGAGGQERFDAVILATPPSEARSLLPAESKIAATAAKVRLQPCWTVMAVFERPLGLAFDGLFFDHGPLSRAVRNPGKPGCLTPEVWILHADHGWCTENAGSPKAQVAASMLESFFHMTAVKPVPRRLIYIQYQPHAAASAPRASRCLWSPSDRIGLCGDGCASARIEGAFLGGAAVAGRLLASASRLVSRDKRPRYIP